MSISSASARRTGADPPASPRPTSRLRKLERRVEELCDRVQLPPAWVERLRGSLEAEIITRQDRNSAEREFITRRLAKLEAERRLLLEAYYAGAVDIALLRGEQERISRDAREAGKLLAGVEATLSEWQEVLVRVEVRY